MQTASQVMVAPLIVEPGASIRVLAELLMHERADGACVVEDGALVGVVTVMDLLFKEKKVHLPTYVTILEAVIPIAGVDRMLREAEKAAAAVVGDLMTAVPITVAPESTLEEVATLMVEKHLTVLPVMEGGVLKGVITKPALLKASGLVDMKD